MSKSRQIIERHPIYANKKDNSFIKREAYDFLVPPCSPAFLPINSDPTSVEKPVRPVLEILHRPKKGKKK